MIAFQVGARWEGLDNLGDEIFAELRPRAERLVKAAALYFEGELKTTLTGRRSGRTYQPSRTGLPHVASAPGESPGVLYGKLRQSIGHSEPEWDGDSISSNVGPGAGLIPEPPYAMRLEWGGEHVTPRDVVVQVAPGEWRRVKAGTVIYIAPRPYMAPTEERLRPIIYRIFEDGI